MLNGSYKGIKFMIGAAESAFFLLCKLIQSINSKGVQKFFCTPLPSIG